MIFKNWFRRHKRDALTEEALAWVNGLRAEYGIGAPLKDLPRGEVASARRCPLAQAVGNGVTDATVYQHASFMIDGSPVRVDLPPNVFKWENDFDLHRYPQYIKR